MLAYFPNSPPSGKNVKSKPSVHAPTIMEHVNMLNSDISEYEKKYDFFLRASRRPITNSHHTIISAATPTPSDMKKLAKLAPTALPAFFIDSGECAFSIIV